MVLAAASFRLRLSNAGVRFESNSRATSAFRATTAGALPLSCAAEVRPKLCPGKGALSQKKLRRIVLPLTYYDEYRKRA